MTKNERIYIMDLCRIPKYPKPKSTHYLTRAGTLLLSKYLRTTSIRHAFHPFETIAEEVDLFLDSLQFSRRPPETESRLITYDYIAE